jgi:hypothetical protein
LEELADSRYINIMTLLENITGTTYSWSPNKNLYDSDNYALLLSQKTSYTTSQQFKIEGGLPNPSTTSTSPKATGSSNALPTLSPSIGGGRGGSNTTMILGVDKKALGKDAAAGIIAGLIGIFAALFCLFVFSIATKKLAAMPPPGGKQPDTEANMADANNYNSAATTPMGGAQDDYYKGKGISSNESFEMASTSGSSRSHSPNGSSSSQKYSPALDSPETLVNTPKNRSNDPYMGLDAIPDEEPATPVWHMEQPRTAYASSTVIPAAPSVTTLPAQAYQQPSARRSDLAPAALMPQYTGDTVFGGPNGFGNGSRAMQPRVSKLYAESQYRNAVGRLSPTEEDFQGRFRSS